VDYDWWEAYVGWQLDVADLKQLAQNSITYSAMNSIEKQAALNEWQVRWDSFVSGTLSSLHALK